MISLYWQFSRNIKHFCQGDLFSFWGKKKLTFKDMEVYITAICQGLRLLSFNFSFIQSEHICCWTLKGKKWSASWVNCKEYFAIALHHLWKCHLCNRRKKDNFLISVYLASSWNFLLALSLQNAVPKNNQFNSLTISIISTVNQWVLIQNIFL